MPESKIIDELNFVKLPEILPIMPIYHTVAFPKMMFPIEIVGDRLISVVDEAMSRDRLMGLVLTRKALTSEGPLCRPEDLHRIGTCVSIKKMARQAGERAQLMVQGLCRFQIIEFIEGAPHLQARIEKIEEDLFIKDLEIEALMANLAALFERVVKLSPFLPQEFATMARSVQEPGTMADIIASIVNASVEEKQKILETLDVRQRLKEITQIVNHQMEILELGSKIQSQVQEDIDKSQREYYLRQQLKAIRTELGESDENRVEVEDYRKKIDAKELTEEARKEALRELDRMTRMHPSSAEYSVAATYLDWITSLPWNEMTQDNQDIKQARRILDEDHFGLDKAKRRIIEYLAVRKLKPDTQGPILCFVGPPGTGKTSLAHSIARALGRKFFRISLGGVRDEAEIRGHRRTYVGALPGRIIQGIRRAESSNPIFVLDEIDKVGSDFRGDPSSALLEVLDPEQNSTFVDHYLDVTFDLSPVMFITTANILDTIPPALRDRLEVIELPGYTQDEKLRIAQRYLIPKQREAHGLTPEQIKFTDGATKAIIAGYTREAGVRNLEREIASVCRSVASRIAEGEISSAVINAREVPRYLGPVRMISEARERISKPGIAMGLAWTPAGGELMFVEATAMKGRKGLTLTGQLGEVMKESASAALSFIRSNAEQLGIPVDFFENTDIHIHVPAGAIPKDGPSAGVTMFTALVSLLTNSAVKNDLAMTGEITLRGLVLPVGGIKEKVLAAHRAGIKRIILPKWNRKDLEEIPPKVRKEMTFNFVNEMLEVLNLALVKR
ncbi:ATP-dependent Lon protease [Syntrophus gentianae]|uniref:Lon protease n=1 Tax=Syntrophus gentianae TaxID=43775 RepID=A0A1H7YC32_9BACT|nr:endopeptidase La [Syntrophus gentianae]SEM42877.1 ATP-dependent Lon protease [Syntrophus gentianae]